MTTRQVIGYSLIIPSTLSVWLWLSDIINKTSSTENWTFFIILILFCGWAIGIIIGMILFAIVKKPAKEPLLYLLGQLIVIVSIASLVGIDKYREYSHQRDFANIEHNHQFVGTDPDAYYAVVRPSENIRTAFTALENSFSNPNDFKLSSFSTQKKDTVYDAHSDTVRYIFFTYQVKGQAERFACVRVFNNKATIETLAGDPATDAIYQPVKEQFKQDKQETLESVKEATRLLEDSIRRRKEAAAKKTLAE